MRNWLPPEAIDDVLPDEASRLEALRRALLDHFAERGYRLVQPPLIEHLGSLLTGSGRDLDLARLRNRAAVCDRAAPARAARAGVWKARELSR